MWSTANAKVRASGSRSAELLIGARPYGSAASKSLAPARPSADGRGLRLRVDTNLGEQPGDDQDGSGSCLRRAMTRCLNDHPAASAGSQPDGGRRVARVGGDDDKVWSVRGGKIKAEGGGREAGVVGRHDVAAHTGPQHRCQFVGGEWASDRHRISVGVLGALGDHTNEHLRNSYEFQEEFADVVDQTRLQLALANTPSQDEEVEDVWVFEGLLGEVGVLARHREGEVGDRLAGALVQPAVDLEARMSRDQPFVIASAA